MWASLIPGIVGAATSLLSRPPKMKESALLAALKDLVGQARGVYNSTDFEALNARATADEIGFAEKVGSRSRENLRAARYASGEDPTMYNSSASVAEGVALRDAMRSASIRASDRTYNTPMLKIGLLQGIGGMAQSGVGNEQQQNMMQYQIANQNYQAQQQAISQLGGMMPWDSMMKGRTNPGPGNASYLRAYGTSKQYDRPGFKEAIGRMRYTL